MNLDKNISAVMTSDEELYGHMSHHRNASATCLGLQVFCGSIAVVSLVLFFWYVYFLIATVAFFALALWVADLKIKHGNAAVFYHSLRSNPHRCSGDEAKVRWAQLVYPAYTIRALGI